MAAERDSPNNCQRNSVSVLVFWMPRGTGGYRCRGDVGPRRISQIIRNPEFQPQAEQDQLRRCFARARRPDHMGGGDEKILCQGAAVGVA